MRGRWPVYLRTYIVDTHPEYDHFLIWIPPLQHCTHHLMCQKRLDERLAQIPIRQRSLIPVRLQLLVNKQQTANSENVT